MPKHQLTKDMKERMENRMVQLKGMPCPRSGHIFLPTRKYTGGRDYIPSPGFLQQSNMIIFKIIAMALDHSLCLSSWSEHTMTQA